MGLGGGGSPGTPIDISPFYLQNQIFFSLQLRRHAETTLHFGHLHDNKCKQIIRPEVLSQQIHCNNGTHSLPNETSPDEFVSRTVYASAS